MADRKYWENRLTALDRGAVEEALAEVAETEEPVYIRLGSGGLFWVDQKGEDECEYQGRIDGTGESPLLRIDPLDWNADEVMDYILDELEHAPTYPVLCFNNWFANEDEPIRDCLADAIGTVFDEVRQDHLDGNYQPITATVDDYGVCICVGSDKWWISNTNAYCCWDDEGPADIGFPPEDQAEAKEIIQHFMKEIEAEELDEAEEPEISGPCR